MVLSYVGEEEGCLSLAPLSFSQHIIMDSKIERACLWLYDLDSIDLPCEQMVAGSGGTLVVKNLHMWT